MYTCSPGLLLELWVGLTLSFRVRRGSSPRVRTRIFYGSSVVCIFSSTNKVYSPFVRGFVVVRSFSPSVGPRSVSSPFHLQHLPRVITQIWSFDYLFSPPQLFVCFSLRNKQELAPAFPRTPNVSSSRLQTVRDPREPRQEG